MVCAPPFSISETEVNEHVAKAKDAIDRTAKDYGKI
jgi:adenosylmethionine-8-amino-7-oxononanoate aminotransferase